MAVATGASLESVRFDTSNVPYGDYELVVIANGIGSHEINFCHRRHRPECTCGKSNCCCCPQSPELCCNEEFTVDPQIVRVRAELRTLHRTIEQISRPPAGEPPTRQPKEKRKPTKAEREAAERESAEEKPRGKQPPMR
jgi:hypothetical protein